MPAASHSPLSVVVFTGPARSGKTHELVGRYREALAGASTGQPRRPLWLAPSSRAAAAVRDALVDRGIEACLAPSVWTFQDLSQQILADSRVKLRPFGAVVERELARRVVASTVAKGGLKFFAGAADRAGFVDLLIEHFRELKRRDIRSDAYARIAASRNQSPQHEELARLYAAYEQIRTAHGLVDEEVITWPPATP